MSRTSRPLAHRGRAADEAEWSDRSDRGTALVVAASVLAVVAGAGLRLWTRSDLWLDEALSVNIARLPVGELLDALRHDGHPPLYYLVLHGWMKAAGTGDVAVRLLSAAFSLAALPLAWRAGRHLAGRRAAPAALLLMATSPFAIRYATEARMYALVTLLVLAGWLLLRRSLDAPSLPRLAAVSAVAGLLLLTHYWAFFLLAATVGLLLWRRRRSAPADRTATTRVLAAVLAGGVLFLPWLPSFLDQASSTGTPWADPSRPTVVIARTVIGFGGGEFAEGLLLGIVLILLVTIGVLGRVHGDHEVVLDLRTRPVARPDAVLVAGTLALGTIVSYLAGSAFEPRYMALVLPSFLLLAALGAVALPARAGVVVLALVVCLGLVGGVRNAFLQRTQGGEIGRLIAARAGPGDVVVVCPDQLGPAVTRHLPEDISAVRFPDGDDARFVDWADYSDRVASREPGDFATVMHERAGDATVWLAWMGGYRGFDLRCEAVASRLAEMRGTQEVVVPAGEEFEPAWLHRYPAS